MNTCGAWNVNGEQALYVVDPEIDELVPDIIEVADVLEEMDEKEDNVPVPRHCHCVVRHTH